MRKSSSRKEIRRFEEDFRFDYLLRCRLENVVLSIGILRIKTASKGEANEENGERKKKKKSRRVTIFVLPL